MAVHLSQGQANRLLKTRLAGVHKYHATPMIIDGVRFDSKKEATRYGWLRLRERLGEIRDLRRQQRFAIVMTNLVTGELTDCGAWIADFVYVETASSSVVVEDVKGFRTQVYKLKQKLVEAQYGITITER